MNILFPLIFAVVAPAFAAISHTDLWMDAAAFQERASGLAVPVVPAPHAVAEAAPAAQPIEAPSPAPELPASFTISEKFFSITDSFVMKDSAGKKLGVIREKLISLSKSFTYMDGNGAVQARARARIFALGSVVDVADAQGRPVGAIREEIFKSLFKVYTSYRILRADGSVAATSEKTEFFSTDFVLRGPDGRVVAEMRRGFLKNLLRLTDKWDVRVVDGKAVDPRLIVVIAAYKSSADNDRLKEERREKDEERRRDADKKD